VQFDPQRIHIDGSQARATVTQTMTYRLTRTHEKRTIHLKLRTLFERDHCEWRSTSVIARC